MQECRLQSDVGGHLNRDPEEDTSVRLCVAGIEQSLDKARRSSERISTCHADEKDPFSSGGFVWICRRS